MSDGDSPLDEPDTTDRVTTGPRRGQMNDRQRQCLLGRLRRSSGTAGEEGERFVESIHGIDRALTALDGVDGPDIDEQVRQQRLSNARELVSLLEQRP